MKLKYIESEIKASEEMLKNGYISLTDHIEYINSLARDFEP